MLDKIQVHAVSIQYDTQTDLHVYNMYMYMLFNLLGKESCFCIIHTCVSWSVDHALVSYPGAQKGGADHAHEVIEGECNFLDTEMKTCSKVYSTWQLLCAHGLISTKSFVYSIKLIPAK